MSKAKLRLLAKAQDDMIALRRYSVRQFGVEAANRYVDDLRSLMRLLADNPRAGMPRPEYGAGIRSISKRRHIVFYRAESSTVEIVRVMHHARLLGRDDLA